MSHTKITLPRQPDKLLYFGRKKKLCSRECSYKLIQSVWLFFFNPDGSHQARSDVGPVIAAETVKFAKEEV